MIGYMNRYIIMNGFMNHGIQYLGNIDVTIYNRFEARLEVVKLIIVDCVIDKRNQGNFA